VLRFLPLTLNEPPVVEAVDVSSFIVYSILNMIGGDTVESDL
jgi:hypothetical protein